MTTDDLIQQLKNVIARNENRVYNFGEVRLGDMAHDCLSKIVELEAELAALRQMQPVEPCEWCGTEEQRNESGRVFYAELPHDARQLTTLDDAHLQLAYDKKTGWVLHFEDEAGDRMFDVKILACPNCGKALKDGE